jgi:hydroxymethylglutaryl-CoA lyase
MSERVDIYEVAPRDGLQNEPRKISIADKVALVDRLSDCGFKYIECASFVSPKWVPQMAGSAEVLSQITRRGGVRYAALTPNMHGLKDALAAKANEVAVFGAASEGFSRANTNASIAENLERFTPLVAEAKAQGVPVRGYISCVIDCPYEGVVDPSAVARVTKALWDMGCYSISLGDTLGHGTPETVDAMLKAVTGEVPASDLAGHYHDTNGRALESITVSLEHGLRIFDAAVGGLGGCPYAPGAQGNVDTQAVIAHVLSLGYQSDLDLEKTAEAAQFARSITV